MREKEPPQVGVFFACRSKLKDLKLEASLGNQEGGRDILNVKEMFINSTS